MIQPKVSITVPIYNAEAYLPQCLDSILRQTLDNIEIILVNDGSTDNSGRICDNYAATDSRIKVFHKENGGSASARQVGLEASTGEYYTVCDADDWIEPNMYENLYNRASSHNADLVISGHYTNYPDGKQTNNNHYVFTNQGQYIKDLMLNLTAPSTWSKLFRLDTIRAWHIDYTQGINMGEDTLFLYKFLCNPTKIVQDTASYYHYRRDMEGNTYTNNITKKSVEHLLYIHNWCVSNYPDISFKKAQVQSLINICYAAVRAKEITAHEYKLLVRDISLLEIIKYNLITKKSFLIMVSRIVGINTTRIINRILYKLIYK